jgi:hypothetical protein
MGILGWSNIKFGASPDRNSLNNRFGKSRFFWLEVHNSQEQLMPWLVMLAVFDEIISL